MVRLRRALRGRTWWAQRLGKHPGPLPTRTGTPREPLRSWSRCPSNRISLPCRRFLRVDMPSRAAAAETETKPGRPPHSGAGRRWYARPVRGVGLAKSARIWRTCRLNSSPGGEARSIFPRIVRRVFGSSDRPGHSAGNRAVDPVTARQPPTHRARRTKTASCGILRTCSGADEPLQAVHEPHHVRQDRESVHSTRRSLARGFP